MREEENNKFSQESKKRGFAKKKWVFPAIYIASAALILAGVFWFQSGTTEDGSPDDFAVNEQPNSETDVAAYPDGQDAVPVTQVQENILMPVHDEESVFIQKQYYDYSAPAEEQEAALVFYDNTYYPNTGIDIAMESGESFDVTAALSGTVTKAEKDPLLGNVVELEHENGVTTVYQSLENVQVEVGASVEQGQVIANAGQSVYNKDAGVHVHFEVRKDGNPVNPIDYFNKPLSSVEEKQQKEEASSEENQQSDAAEDGQQESDAPNNGDSSQEMPDASISQART